MWAPWLVTLCASALHAELTGVPKQGALELRVDRLELVRVPLGDALWLLSASSGANLVTSGASSTREVSLDLWDVSVREAVLSLARATGLDVQEDPNTRGLWIGERSAAEPLANPAPATQETRVIALYYPNALDVARAVVNLFGERVQWKLEPGGIGEDLDEIHQRFRRLDALQLGALGRPALESTAGHGDALSAPIGPERAVPDERAIYLSVLRRNNQIALRSADREALDQIEALVAELDVPSPQVLLEVKVLELDLSDGFSSAFEFDIGRANGDSLRFGDGPGPLANTRGPGTLLYQFVDGQVLARMELLERAGRVTTLATPLLLVANNEVSRLFVGEERPIVRAVSANTTLNQNQATTAPSTELEFRPVGTTLLLTPSINADRTVTLRILQETSQVNPNGATIPVVGPLGTVVNQPVDVVATRSVAGTVVAKDGLTLALGGLIDERVADVQTGVPWLMDAPLIGFLFRTERKVRSRRELVVVVRPWVLHAPGEGEVRSRGLGADLLHPSGQDLGQTPLGTFEAREAPRGGLGRHALREMFLYQSGLPDGG